MKNKAAIPVIQTDKILLEDITLLKSAVNSSDEYLENPTKPESVVMTLLTAPRFDFSQNQCRFRLNIALSGQDAAQKNSGLSAEFLIDFIFIIENLSEFILEKNGAPQIQMILGATLLGISFSTARGIVLERTKGTPFAGFILPVINPSQVFLNTLDDGKKQPKTSLASEPDTAYKRKRKS